MLIKFNFIKICKSFSVFPCIGSLGSDSTELNDLGFVKNFDSFTE